MNPEQIDTSKYSDGCQNIEKFFPKEEQRKGYKNLRGFIKMLKRQNKILKGKNITATFTIKLPM